MKFIFEEYLSPFKCFVVETTDTNLINQLILDKNSSVYKWVVGILRSGTQNNSCNTLVHNWHYETFEAFAEITAEECQTTIYLIENYSQDWLYRNSSSCILAKVIYNECLLPSCMFSID